MGYQGGANPERKRASMSGCIDLTGQRFGRLIVLSRSENSVLSSATWLCKCDCGNEKNSYRRGIEEWTI
jgi:hypothetical protein